MVRPRRIVRFCAAALLIQLVLLAPWLGLRSLYASGFRAIANIAFSSLTDQAHVRFETQADSPPMDTAMQLRNVRTRAQATAPLSTFLIGYLPTAVIVSLALAAPGSWRQRCGSLVFCVVFLQFFVAFRVLVRLVDVFSENDSLQAFHLSHLNKAIVAAASQTLSVSMLASFVVPILIWAAVGIRPGQWQPSPPNCRRHADAKPRQTQ